MEKLESRKEGIWQSYNECMCALTSLREKDEAMVNELETNFKNYWEDKKGDFLSELANDMGSQLETRVVELECQEASIKQEVANEATQRNMGNPTGNSDSGTSLDRRLFGNELKIPEFTGNAAEFDSFWESFEELIHKQPYSNMEKLSILLSCCKGDAARALKMFPRTGDSYERAVQQLKNQYQDPKRVTMTMVRQLKSLKQARDDARSLRNTLNDVEAIIATLRRQGETVDTTHTMSMVMDVFPKRVQDEIAKKEFDSGKEWNMEELLSNITMVVRRHEHLENRRELNEGTSHSVFNTQTRSVGKCVGCKGNHCPLRFQDCPRYATPSQKVERLKALKACWKCFSLQHHTKMCRRSNCPRCNGYHNAVVAGKPASDSRLPTATVSYNTGKEDSPNQIAPYGPLLGTTTQVNGVDVALLISVGKDSSAMKTENPSQICQMQDVHSARNVNKTIE
ncbi:hypothetical protein ANCDUO_14172 [Ancylostoma duodenale]|uniref:Uncharacterized protein n=1 Tax=Ancylostoma duodenale TaxID=51022 RepID=A0A0C2G3Y4_9BILA|nr:hypothetical protein ANCDUO_14172 [Ancylostoma duodenale]